MIVITHFTSQIIPLAIGLGVSYWIFSTAHKLEGRLTSIGEYIAWALITLTILSALFSFIYSIKLTEGDYVKDEYPTIKIIQQQPMIDNRMTDEDGIVNDGGNAPGVNREINDNINE